MTLLEAVKEGMRKHSNIASSIRGLEYTVTAEVAEMLMKEIEKILKERKPGADCVDAFHLLETMLTFCG